MSDVRRGAGDCTGLGGPDEDVLHQVEELAVELAQLAGTEIRSALGTMLTVRYKGDFAGSGTLRDPVSEVDKRVEQIMRLRLDERFPYHDIIGEEYEDRRSNNHDFIWAVDPIDGTANFVNGFPLFAAAVGVLYRGRPIVGATWCSTSHALRPGVYHCKAGGPLEFERERVVPVSNPTIRRRLIGLPDASPPGGARDSRKTGSAAIELAFVAAGMLEACRIDTPNIWDVASGVSLVQAANGTIMTHTGDDWHTLERFVVEGDQNTVNLRGWKQPILAGRQDHLALIAATT